MGTRPYNFSIDTDAEAIFLTAGGFIGADTFSEAGEAVINDPKWENHYDCLCDLRPAKKVVVKPEGMEQLVKWMIGRRENLRLQGKIAVLIGRWTLTVLCRLLEFRFRSKQPEFRMFNNEKGALRWLDLPTNIDVQEKDKGAEGQ